MRWFGHCFCSFVEMWTRVHHSFIWTNSKIICICVSICFFFHLRNNSQFFKIFKIQSSQHNWWTTTQNCYSNIDNEIFAWGEIVFILIFLKKISHSHTFARAHTQIQFTYCTTKKKKQDKRNCDLKFVLESRMSSLFLFFCSLHLILILIWNEFPIEIETLKWLLIEPESITVLIPLSLEWSGPVHWWFQVNSRSEINMFCLCR